MGCIKLDILEKSFVPMKVVYRNFGVEQNNAQRFLRVDPLAEIYTGWSGFAYVGNNPISYIDPNGLYRTEKQANRMKKRADRDGYDTGDVYKSGDEYGFSKGDGTHSFKKKHFGLKGIMGEIWDLMQEGDNYLRQSHTKSNHYFKISGEATFGIQAGIGIEVNKSKFKADINVASIKLAHIKGQQVGSDTKPFKLDSRIGNSDGVFSITQGLSVPLLGFENSFDTRGYGHISGTNLQQYSAGPFKVTNQGEKAIRLGFGAALFLGVNGYVEFGTKSK